MRNKYPQEFKDEAVGQGHSVVNVAKRLGITDKSIYNWLEKAKQSPQEVNESDEIKHLKKELKRVTEEREILKEAAVDSSESRKGMRS